jgi:hypothetical protein
LAAKVGLERLGFLTLTFGDQVTDAKEAQRRYNSLNTGILRERYPYAIRVVERQKSGRIHYHLVIALVDDIRSGFSFADLETKRGRGRYQSANAALKAEWKFWRENAEKYGFGRTELLPVKSTAEGIARYVGKYISKHVEGRSLADKGIRLVEYSKGARMQSSRFAFNTLGAKLARAKVGELARAMNSEFSEIHKHLGRRWCFRFRRQIALIQPAYWSEEAREFDSSPPYMPDTEEVVRRVAAGYGFRLTPAQALTEIALMLTTGIDLAGRVVIESCGEAAPPGSMPAECPQPTGGGALLLFNRIKFFYCSKSEPVVSSPSTTLPWACGYEAGIAGSASARPALATEEKTRILYADSVGSPLSETTEKI